MTNYAPKLVLNASEIDKSLSRMAHEMIERHKNGDFPSLVGIRTCGEFLARRLADKVAQFSGKTPQIGVLDINLYRDDLTRIAERPVIRETVIGFDVNDRTVILVDDVLYTGRTVRCALDALADFGRPKSVELAVLVDRGHRELPIRADYVGKNIPTAEEEIVHVHLSERDRADEVVVGRKGAK